MARKYARGDIGRWAKPPRQSQIAVGRWRVFTREIQHRIAELRATEGIDGRIEDWRTFDPPLPPLAALTRPPIRLRLKAAPTLPRGVHGRLMRREKAS